MKETIIVYGSTSGNCESVANRIAKALGLTSVISASELTKELVNNNANLILGSSTWGSGDLQDEWYDAIEVIKSSDLTGKTVAVFGCGDSCGFSTTFCVVDGEFVGLALDEDNESDKTDSRISAWVEAIKPQL